MDPDQPPDMTKLALDILAYTRVDVNPKKPQPGERMTVETVPGLLPNLPANLEGNLPSVLGGTTAVVLKALVKPIGFSVKYKLVVDGKEVSGFTLEPLTPGKLENSDPLKAMFRVFPPLVSEIKNLPHKTVKGELIATVKVSVEGVTPQEKEVKIPLELVAIPLPTLLVLKGDPNDPDWRSNKVFVMTRRLSTLTDIGSVVTTLNATIQTLNSLKDIGGVGPGFLPLVTALEQALEKITSAGSVAGLAVEEAPNLDDYDNFDDEARSSILFGPVGTKVEFFSGFDYNANVGGENEKSTFTITQDFGKIFGDIESGFGVHKQDDWYNLNWDTDNEDNMNDMESCKFVS